MSCIHESVEVRRRINAAGRPMIGKQCLECGALVGQYIAKKDWPALPPPWNVELAERWAKEQQELHLAERAEKTRAWWHKYNEYLRSPKWASKRRTVLGRDLLCQACLSRNSTQVHHKTYEHVFDEPLFDLVGVCEPCHELITNVDRARRAGDR